MRPFLLWLAGTVLIKNADELLNFSNEEEARLEEVQTCS
jgi:hypothetical protein